MKVYVVKGHGYDGFDVYRETYTEVYSSREEAEKRVRAIAEDQRQFVSCEDGMDYYESFNYKNGVLADYTLTQYCDLQKPLQKEAYVLLSGFVTICKVDEFVPNIETSPDAHRDVEVACVSIKEVELKDQQS